MEVGDIGGDLMTQLRAVFQFALDGLGLWVDAHALGQTIELEGGDLRFQLCLPERRDDFGISAEPSEEGCFATHHTRTQDGQTLARAVRVVRMIVHGDVEFDVEAPAIEHAALMREWLGASRAALEDLLNRLRHHEGTHVLGLTTNRPEPVGLASLVHGPSGERLPISVGPSAKLIMLEASRSLTTDDLQAAAGRSTGPDLAATMLSDAMYLAWIADHPQPRTALLFAAIATESSIFSAVRDIAGPSRSALVELVLARRSRPVEHLDETMMALCGRSLRVDAGRLYRDATTMFERRNRVAHGAPNQPSDQEMTDSVRTAVSVARWIDGLRTDVDEGRRTP